jgi:prepilin-type processing-associated H-X9-DG protein
LAALIIPQIQTRISGRRQAACFQHPRILAVAIVNYLTDSREQLPWLRGQEAIEDDRDLATPPRRMPWTIAILPQLDDRALYDHFTAPVADQSQSQRPEETDESLTANALPVFTCPDSPNHGLAGRISYVANADYMPEADRTNAAFSVDGPNLGRILWRVPLTDGSRTAPNIATDEQLGISHAAAVLIDPVVTDGEHRFAHRSNTLASMYDGASCTLLFAENDDARPWADLDLLSLGFGLPLELDGRTPRFVGDGTLEQALALQTGIRLGNARMNAQRTRQRLARPSSSHAGGVIVSFCDGRVLFLSETIDERVYAQVLTPSGSRHGQEIVTQNQFTT